MQRLMRADLPKVQCSLSGSIDSYQDSHRQSEIKKLAKQEPAGQKQLPPQEPTGELGDIEQQPLQWDPSEAAMKELKELGAIVYPPKDKANLDWDILAGLLLMIDAPSLLI